MIDITLLRENPELVKASLKRRGKDESLVDTFLALDTTWREGTQEIEALRAEQKQYGKDDIEKAKALKGTIQEKEGEHKEVETKRDALLKSLPNILADDVPDGLTEDENKVIRSWGEKPTFDFEPKDHYDLGVSLGLINKEKAAEVSGARFTYITGDLVRLQFALSSWVLSLLTDETVIKEIADTVEPGYSSTPFTPVLTPGMITPETYERMGRLTEENKDDKYYIEKDDLYLAGSAEHTLGPLHMDETLKEAELPKRYLGYSTNYRREAGTYGKDTKGIIRMHQFDKWEMESFTTPEHGETEQRFMVAIQEYLMQQLGLPYQVIANCAGDTGGPNKRQFDIEAWIPAQNTYRETHSADYMDTYQARRLKTKVLREDNTKTYVHMNDATVLSMRPLIAILENYQTKEGTVRIPDVLQPFMNGQQEIR